MTNPPLIRKDHAKVSEGRRLPDAHTMRLREVSLLRSLFIEHQKSWGPNVDEAMCWMAKGQIEATYLHPITEAIQELKVKLGRMPTEAAVIDLLHSKIDRNGHVTTIEKAKRDAVILLSGLLDGTRVNGEAQADPLPLSIQEVEAQDMIAWYKGKDLWRKVAAAEEKMRSNFYDAVTVAKELGEELGWL